MASFDMLVYDLIEAGYMQEALKVAERYVKLDPLSPAAHLRLNQALYGVGRIDEALQAVALADQLGGDFQPFLLTVHFVTVGRDDEATKYLATWMEKIDLPTGLAHEFINGARDPVTGPAFLDEQIPKIVASVPEQYQFDVRRLLVNFYGYFGHLDRQFEIILAVDPSGSTWTDADDMIFSGTIHHLQGFTAHPKYLEATESMGILELWDQRGAPDFCTKEDGAWVCE
jgi:hypothetical protein